MSRSQRETAVCIGMLILVFGTFGLVGEWDHVDQVNAQDAREERNAQLQANCLPSAPGDMAVIQWRRDGALVCAITPAGGQVRANVLKGRVWTPL